MVAVARVNDTLSESPVRKFSQPSFVHLRSRIHRPRSRPPSHVLRDTRTLPTEFVTALAAATSDRAGRLLTLSNQCFERAIGNPVASVQPQLKLFEAAYLAFASAESEPQGSHGSLPTELLIARAAVNLDMRLEDVVLSQQLAGVYAYARWDEFSVDTLRAWCKRIRRAVASAGSVPYCESHARLRCGDE
jgi:hypothetical protein